VSFATLLTALATTALAELPDKSMLASLVLGTRFAPRWVWLGVAAAFTVHVILAVTAGTLLTLLPETVVGSVAAVLFAVGAVALARPGGRKEPGDDAEASVRPRSAMQVAAISFAVVFVGEWGDVTQLTTAGLAARSGDPVSVGAGAVLALWTVAALATAAGRSVLRVVPETLVRRIGAAVLAVLAMVTTAQLLAG
jgi:putative Ca2+/H+ antiporter (TMEM165/GDT1 family)